MKKSPIFVLSVAVLALVACNTSQDPSSVSSADSSSSLTSDLSSDSLGDSSSSESPSSSSTNLTQSQALALFNSALKKDYNNMTMDTTLQNPVDWSETPVQESETSFSWDGYTLVYSNSRAAEGYETEDCYSLYYSDATFEHSYLYFDSDYSNADGWDGGYLETGYNKADLAVWHTYPFVPHILKHITSDDVTYANGYYSVSDPDVIEALNLDGFGYIDFEIESVLLSIGSTGYFSQIIAFGEDSSLSNPEVYESVTLSNFGTTSCPSNYTIEHPFSETYKKGYWQMQGWDHDYEDAYCTGATVSLKAEQDKDYTQGAAEAQCDAIMDVDDVIDLEYVLTPSSFEPWQIKHEANLEWHWTDGMFEKVNDSTSSGKFRAINPEGGSGEIWVTFTGEDGELTSNKVKIKVNALPDQVTEGAIYHFNWTKMEVNSTDGSSKEYKEITAINEADSKALYTITAGMNAQLIDGRNGQIPNYFQSGRQYLTLSPTANDAMNHVKQDDLIFDFGEQQVSSISFKYGFFYENHASNIDKLNHFYIETKDDGEWYKEVSVDGAGTKTEAITPEEASWHDDIVDEIKENISTSFMKTYTASFAPTSHVRIDLPLANTLGTPLQICIDSVCFFANDQCHNYVAPEDQPVQEVQLTPEKATIFVGKEQRLNANVLPQGADSTLEWHVEEGKNNIVSVDNGVVTAKAPGQAKVWATSPNGAGGTTKKSNEVTITVENEPDFTGYVDLLYKEDDGDALVKFVDEETATVTKDEHTVVAKITSYTVNSSDKTFVLSNENGEGFKLSITNTGSRVTITDFSYKGEDNQIHQSGGTDYCSKITAMTGFTLKLGDLSLNTTTNSSTCDVIAGKSGVLKVTTSPSDSMDNDNITCKVSSDNSNVTIGETQKANDKSLQTTISYASAGTSIVTVTVSDLYGNTFTKTITFNITAKVEVEDNNWSVVCKDSENIYAGAGGVKVGVEFDDTVNVFPTSTYDYVWDVGDGNLSSVEEITTRNKATIGSNNKEVNLTPKAEGEVTVFCTIKSTNRQSYTKALHLTIRPLSEHPLGKIIGTYKGSDCLNNNFTLKIDVNGATLTIDFGSGTTYHFTYSEYSADKFLFKLDDDPTVILYVDSEGMKFSDNGAYIDDKESTYFVYTDSITFD